MYCSPLIKAEPADQKKEEDLVLDILVFGRVIAGRALAVVIGRIVMIGPILDGMDRNGVLGQGKTRHERTTNIEHEQRTLISVSTKKYTDTPRYL